jgi:hypothetical protein
MVSRRTQFERFTYILPIKGKREEAKTLVGGRATEEVIEYSTLAASRFLCGETLEISC